MRLLFASGVGQRTAEIVLLEIGTDLAKFPTAAHLCAWAGVAPGNHESAGKQRSGKTRKGNRALRHALVEAARSASRSKGTYFQAQYFRLRSRRGDQRVIVAVAHSILQMIYYLLVRKEPYTERGGNYFDQLRPVDTAKRLTSRSEKLGYKVTLEAAQAA